MHKYKIVWEKSKPTNFLNVRHQPLRKHEDICVFYHKKCTYNPQFSEGTSYDKGMRKLGGTGSYNFFKSSHVKSNDKRHPTDIIYFKTAESEQYGTFHPTQKPVALCEYLIKTYSNENDIILDNCMGSGTTAIACINTKRNFIGFEKDEKYCNIANSRITEYLEKVNHG